MFKNKVQSISIDKYFEIKKNEYVTVQLVPAKSTKNNSTDSIATMINQMYLQLNKFIKVENKKLIITPQVKVSYYMHITKDDIQFYFIIPKVHYIRFKTKLAETWRNIEIKQVDDIPMNLNDCTKYQLKYKYDDALSLSVDKRNNHLLEANLSILEVLEKEETTGIYYNFIPTGERENNYFKVMYKNIIEKYKNGENLKKNKNLLDIAILALKFLLGMIDDFISCLQSKNNKEIASVQKSQRKTIGIKKKISSSTERKVHSDICKTQIVVVAKSNKIERENTLAKSMCNTFKSIDDNNELIAKKIKKDININSIQIDHVAINKTTTEECQNFISLPGSELINQHKNINHIETKENPIPEELKEGIINLGPIKYKDQRDKVYANNDKDLQSLPHVIMGGSRSGKSTLSINICKNLIDAGEGLILIDFIRNTEFSDVIRAITPTDRLIDIDLSVYKCIQALSYNEYKITPEMDAYEVSKIARRKTSNLLELINIMNDDDKQLAPKMRKYIGAAARIAFCFNSSSMKDILRILQIHTVRYEYINKLSKELYDKLEDSVIALKELDEYTKETKDKPSQLCGTKDNKIEGIIDRIDLFRENDVIDAMFSKDPTDNIDFVKSMDEGKVIIIRMRDKDFDDETSIDVLTTFFIQKIWLATKIRGSKHKEPKKVNVIIDEVFQVPTAQKILTKTFVQSAKFKLKYILTLHNLEGLSKEARASLKGANTTYTLIAGVDKEAFESLEKEFAVHGYCVDDLLNLKRYTALHLIKGNDSYKALITNLPPELKVDIEEENVA